MGAFDPEAGPARHRADEDTPSRLPAIGAVMGLVVLAAGGLAAWSYAGGPAGTDSPDGAASPCGDVPVVVAANREIAAPLRLSLTEAGCSHVTVQAADPVAVSRSLVTGVDVPDYWVPDSILWAARTAGVAQTPPTVLVDSLAASPVVLASAAQQKPARWTDALLDPSLVLGDPLTSSTSAALLLLGTSGKPVAQAAATVAPLAQQEAGTATVPLDDPQRIAFLGDARVGLTAVREQQVLTAGTPLVSSVPRSGTLLLDYPLLVTAPAARAAQLKTVSTGLAQFSQGPGFQAQLEAARFRPPSGAAIQGGVGPVTTVPLPDSGTITTALGTWQTLAVPIRALALVDVSASMDFPAQRGSRMDVTVGAMTAGMSLFPDSAAVGLWAFSERLDGARDHRELVPIRGLDSIVGRATQREHLAARIDGLRRLTTGGTGLYDSVLASYRHLRRHYDPHAVNSILLFSDGANDDPGSISQDELLRQLLALQDPKRPIQLIAIGITHDADEVALARIAEATGGFSMIAERPEDMAAVFQKAMQARF